LAAPVHPPAHAGNHLFPSRPAPMTGGKKLLVYSGSQG